MSWNKKRTHGVCDSNTSDDDFNYNVHVGRSNKEVAVVYFRTGYSPQHYPTEKVCTYFLMWLHALIFNPNMLRRI